MRHLFEPRLVNGAFGDPGLYFEFRDERRSLLFDLGDITALPPRSLMRLSHAFVTHAHMDHFSGFDHLLRVVLGRKERVALVGGPEFVARVEHKLRAYAWNVVHRYEPELVLDVHEIGPDGAGRRARFSSRAGSGERTARRSRWSTTSSTTSRPSACAQASSTTTFRASPMRSRRRHSSRWANDRLEALGFSTGPWLRELKSAVLAGAAEDTPIEVRWRDRGGEHAVARRSASFATSCSTSSPAGGSATSPISATLRRTCARSPGC